MEDTARAIQETTIMTEELPPQGKPIVTEPDMITIYDTRTGEESKFRVYSRDQLLRKLSQKREDGTTVFTTIKPSVIVRRGNLKCMLHLKDPNRQHYDELGLTICKKDNLTSAYQVKRHMQKKHPMEWEAIEAERIERERLEDRQYQKATLKALSDITILAEEPKLEETIHRIGRPPKEK